MEKSRDTFPWKKERPTCTGLYFMPFIMFSLNEGLCKFLWGNKYLDSPKIKSYSCAKFPYHWLCNWFIGWLRSVPLRGNPQNGRKQQALYDVLWSNSYSKGRNIANIGSVYAKVPGGFHRVSPYQEIGVGILRLWVVFLCKILKRSRLYNL